MAPPRWRCMLIAALEVAIAGLPIILGSAVAGAGVQQDDLSVRSFAQRLALTANDAKLDRWQTEVDQGIASFQDGLKKGYPAKPTRDSLHGKSRFALKDTPGEVFRFSRVASPRIFDFEALSGPTKRMVDADVFYKDAQVLEDPLKDAAAMVARAGELLEGLKALGPKLREDVDVMTAKSAHTLELLKRGLAAEKLKILAQYESQATAELEAAKKVVESIQRADGTVVKATAEAGRLLRLAGQQIEGIGQEAASVRKALRNVEVQFSHHVASSGAEMNSSVQHMKRAEEELASLSKTFQEGMAELKRRKAMLQLIEEAERSLQQVEDELRTLVGLGLSAGQIRKDAQAAEAARDSLALQQLLLRAGDGTLRVGEAVGGAEAMLADFALRVQAVDSMVASVQSAALKARGVSAAEQLRSRAQQVQLKLQEKALQATNALAAVKEEVSRQLRLHLGDYEKAIEDGDAWVRQAAQQHKMLNAALLAREEESAGARKAAEQFSKMLMEDVEEAQNKVTSGQAQWPALEAQYSFESRRAAAERLMEEAQAAAGKAAAAFRSVERQATDFFAEAAQTIEDLKKLEKKVHDLAEAARTQHADLLKEQQRLEAAGAASAAAAGAEAAAARDRAETAVKIGQRFAQQRLDVAQQVEETKAVLEEMGKRLLQKPGAASGKGSKGGAQGDDALSTKEILTRYGNKANEHLKYAQQHLDRAKEVKLQVLKVQQTLQGDVKDLRTALKATSVRQRVQDSSSGSQPSTPAPPASGGADQQWQSSSKGLSDTLERRIGHLTALAAELQKQQEASHKQQREAQKAAANLRLAGLRAVVGEGSQVSSELEAQEMQAALDAADAVAADVVKKAKVLEEGLLLFQEQEGGSNALNQVLEEVLIELANLLKTTENKLGDVMQLGVPAFETLVQSAHNAAEALHAERKAAAAEGKSADPDSAAAAEFAAADTRARQLGEFLSGEAEEVEVCAKHLISTLVELQTFRDSHGLAAATQQPRSSNQRRNSSSSNAGVVSSTPGVVAGPRSRRLGASSNGAATAGASVEDLQQQAVDLKGRAEEAVAGLKARMQHLQALRDMGTDAPPALAAASYGAAAKSYLIPDTSSKPDDSAADTGAGAGTGDGSGSGEEEEQGKEEEDERTEGTTSPRLYLAVGIASGLLLLLGLSGCGLYARRQRARRLKSLKQGVSTSTTHQHTTGGDPPGDGGPFSSPTRDFDEATHGGGTAAEEEEVGGWGEEEQMKQAALGEPLGTVVTAVAAPEAVMGGLETGKTETTRRQYFVDEHHTVARELSHSQPPRCRTPLVFFCSTPKDLRSPRADINTAGTAVRTPRLWESKHREGSFRGRSASPTMGHHRQQYVQQQQQQEQEHSRRARQLENLEAAVKLEQETQDSEASSGSLHVV